MSPLILIAFSLGLRHAVDADHISAIDGVTRKLLASGQRPFWVGLFFSLGHSTVVILLTLLLVFFSSFIAKQEVYFIQKNLPLFEQTGSLIGTLISSFFLGLVGILNLFVLIDLFKNKQKENFSLNTHLKTKGLLTRVLRPVLRTVDASWKMYPVGFLFGLGFDTASEVALLALSASAAHNFPLFTLMLLPLAFTLGMTLIDSLDGIVMLHAYSWASVKPKRRFYYNFALTSVSTALALGIGIFQILKLISLA